MSDGSSKALRVDEGQTVGDVLEVLLEKTHCDGSEDWSLVETQHQLQTGETQLVGSELEEDVGKSSPSVLAAPDVEVCGFVCEQPGGARSVFLT